MSQTAPRPSAVSSACLFIGLSSALLLVYVMQWLTSWDSLQQQEIIGEVAEAMNLAETATLATTLRVVLMVMVVVLVTGGVGAVYTARGDQLSRVLVSVVGVLVAMLFVFTGNVLGFIPGAFAIASVVRLWGRDATRWFAERNGKSSSESQEAVAPAAPSHVTAGRRAAAGYPPPPPNPSMVTPQSVPRPPHPSSVSTATLVTVLGSATAGASAAFFLAFYAAVPRRWWIDAQRDNPLYQRLNITEADLSESLTATAVLAGITIVMSVLALIVAYALSRRNPWASSALVALCVLTIALGVFTMVGVVWAGLAVWVLVLLRRDATRTWLAQGR